VSPAPSKLARRGHVVVTGKRLVLRRDFIAGDVR